MPRWDSKRIRCSQVHKYLVFAVLGISGMMLFRYVSNQCDIEDFQNYWDNVKSQTCREGFYSHINLKATDDGKVNCSKILNGDEMAIDEAIKLREEANKYNRLNEQDYVNMTRDCNHFKELRKYIVFPMSKEEEHFPIAYSMVIHDKIEMFERLLRAIYTPQNIYCIHVDQKSPIPFKAAVKAIVNCFDNVFLASKQVKVIYASWSRVQADLNCMEDLLKSNVQWKYLLNTCGTDFPLKTNAEMVTTLKSLNGKNSMESEKPSSFKQRRWEYHHEVKDSISGTDIKKSPPPINSPMFTGNAYIVICRDFVKYLFENQEAQKLIEWIKDSYSPDEHLWSTLNRMPGVPGASPSSDKYQLSDMNAVARMVKWSYIEGDLDKGAAYPRCTGTHRRAVCVYGTGDLSWLLQQRHLLANKFDPDVDNFAIQCLEEHLRYKSIFRKNL